MKKGFFILCLALNFKAAAFADYQNKGLGFVAPQVDNVSSITNPHQGEIAYDSADSTFKGYNGSSWDSLTYIAPEAASYLSAASSSFSLTTSGFISDEWAQMSGNSITLTPGSWTLNGLIVLSGSTDVVTRIIGRWATANGDNTTTGPTSATLDAGHYANVTTLQTGAYTVHSMTMMPARITVTSNTTIYLDASVTITTAGDGTLKTYIYAEKIR